MPLTDPWLVRWDTAAHPRPRFEPATGGDVAFHGYLFDRDQLSVTPSAPDAVLVAAAYERWQQTLFEKLRGGFAIAIWDEHRRCLVVGRDAMGLVPCFYSWNGRRLLVSPSIDRILAEPGVDGRFNRVLVAEYLQNVRGYQRIDETFYEDIRRLPPAHMLSVRGSALSVTRYWDPIPPGFVWATEDEVSRFTAVLGAAVDRCLSAGADSVALSGGLDSVSIALMAADRRRGAAPLHAVSLRFSDRSCDEGDVQTAVAGALGMPQVMRSFDDCVGDDPFGGALHAICRVSPSPPLSAWQPMYDALFRSAVSRGVRGPMMGTGGDELYYVNMGYAADRLAALDVRGLWRFCRTLQRNWSQPLARLAWHVVWDSAVKSELRRAARRVLDAAPRVRDRALRGRLRRRLPPWLAPGNTELVSRLERRPLEVVPIEMAPGEGAYVRAMRRLPQSPTFALELEQLHAWTGGLGLRLFFPYFDRDLVEMSLRMPPASLVAGQRTKAPLRQLVERRLPDVEMPQRKVIFDRQFHALFRRHGARAWSALGGASLLTELGIVDPRGVSAMMSRYFSGAETSLSPWLVLSMERWLRARSGIRKGPTTGGLR